LILALKADDNGWSHEWSTYKGRESLGATVTKGSKATWILAPSTFVTKEEKAKAAAEGRDPRFFTTFRAVPIFNAAQVDGYTPKPVDMVTHDGLDTINEWLEATGAVIKTAAHNQPSYSPISDTVMLPPAAFFVDAASFAATAAHEVGHWTGHESRLNRKQLNVFGSADYAREELVAELAAATIAAALGYEVEPSLDHAHYLASWLEAIQNDPKALWSAASAAAKAVNFLDGIAPLNLKTEEVD
jgi:antirestriction protein ArdC